MPIHAHVEAAAAATVPSGERIKRLHAAHRDDEPHADEVIETPIVAVDQTSSSARVLDLGDRRVELVHPGRGHYTAGDLVVAVPDADVLLVGDLVEESGPPGYGEDCWPLEWPATLDVVLGATTDATVARPRGRRGPGLRRVAARGGRSGGQTSGTRGAGSVARGRWRARLALGARRSRPCCSEANAQLPPGGRRLLPVDPARRRRAALSAPRPRRVRTTDRYGSDVLAGDWRHPRGRAQEVPAALGMIVEEVITDWCEVVTIDRDLRTLSWRTAATGVGPSCSGPASCLRAAR
ncbi:MAG: hypothetical protein R2734_15495 [Nocardioides sp.]